MWEGWIFIFFFYPGKYNYLLHTFIFGDQEKYSQMKMIMSSKITGTSSSIFVKFGIAKQITVAIN